MKKILSYLFSLTVLALILAVPASANSPSYSPSAVPSIDALISGQVAPVNEDSSGIVHVSADPDTGENYPNQLLASNDNLTVDIRQISSIENETEYLLRAYTPLEKSDSSDQGGPLAFFEVTYIRTTLVDYPFVKVLSMRAGWRSTSISNRAMCNLHVDYLARGEYYREDTGTVSVIRDADDQHLSSSPIQGEAYGFVPSPRRFFNEYVSQIYCTARYDVKNTVSSSIVEENCGIYIQFGDITIPGTGGH